METVKKEERSDLTKWKMSNGKDVKIHDMEMNHLINTLNLLKRKPGWRSEYKKVIQEEIDRRKTVEESFKDFKVLRSRLGIDLKMVENFLIGQCGYQILDIREITDQIIFPYSKLAISKENDAEEFKNKLKTLIDTKKLDSKAIEEYGKKYLISSVFLKEWKYYFHFMFED